MPHKQVHVHVQTDHKLRYVSRHMVYSECVVELESEKCAIGYTLTTNKVTREKQNTYMYMYMYVYVMGKRGKGFLSLSLSFLGHTYCTCTSVPNNKQLYIKGRILTTTHTHTYIHVLLLLLLLLLLVLFVLKCSCYAVKDVLRELFTISSYHNNREQHHNKINSRHNNTV